MSHHHMQLCLLLKMLHSVARAGITTLHIKLRATGGNKTKTHGHVAQSALRALARSGMKIGHIEDVTLVFTNSTRRKGGIQEEEAVDVVSVILSWRISFWKREFSFSVF